MKACPYRLWCGGAVSSSRLARISGRSGRLIFKPAVLAIRRPLALSPESLGSISRIQGAAERWGTELCSGKQEPEPSNLLGSPM